VDVAFGLLVEESITLLRVSVRQTGGSSRSSEEIVGRALADFSSRDEIVLATKVYFPMSPGPNGGGLSRKAIMREIEKSLTRLGTDYVDLYQIHRFDPTTPVEETVEALHDVV
jgi:aryl-alcohol dehydrogenase-like predicted oxidoreductase